MTHPPIDLVALCIWREARGEGEPGMQAVACVINNRAQRHHMTPAAVVMVPWAFSSMTAHGDPQLGTLPEAQDLQFEMCVHYADSLGSIHDTTHGATLYYDDSIPFPHTWNRSAVKATVKIGRLNFFREL